GGFALLAGSQASEAVGRTYFDARILGAPAVFLNLALSGYFIGTGRSAQALAMAIAQNIGNALLNVWFIWGLGLQARGAGLASMASQYLALGVALVLLLASRPRWPSQLRSLLNGDAIRALFALNRDLLIRTLLMLTVFATFTNVSALGGEERLAAFAILIRLHTAAAYVVDGAAFSLEALVGGLWHQGRREELRWLVRFAMTLALAAATVLALVLIVGGPWVYGMLTEHAQVIRIARRFELWMIATLYAGVVAWIFDGLFIGLTWGRRLRRAAWWSAAAFVPGASYAWWVNDPTVLWMAFFAFTAARAATLGKAWRAVERA
ncbi:MAG: MATE family efflux transporter, partial [Myxococcota bacterium]